MAAISRVNVLTVTEITSALYQKIYDDPNLKYGQAKFDRCPGTRYFPKYKTWLVGSVVDLGCGTGDTVKHLTRKGYPAQGFDWIEPRLANCAKADITRHIDLSAYDTALALDVFEHLTDDQLAGLCTNMRQCDWQVITVANGSSKVYGVELHVNRKSIEEWQDFLSDWFFICGTQKLDIGRSLFLCIPPT